MGSEQKILAGTAPPNAPQELRAGSFLWETVNRGFLGSIQGVTGRSNRQRYLDLKPTIPRRNREIDAYSAAVANLAFGFADDIMKSEMRGTISDLKREPLKTP